MNTGITTGFIFLIVTIVAIVSVLRQLKIKNMLALLFSGLVVLSFGFFSVMTITCELIPGLGICTG